MAWTSRDPPVVNPTRSRSWKRAPRPMAAASGSTWNARCRLRRAEPGRSTWPGRRARSCSPALTAGTTCFRNDSISPAGTRRCPRRRPGGLGSLSVRTAGRPGLPSSGPRPTAIFDSFIRDSQLTTRERSLGRPSPRIPSGSAGRRSTTSSSRPPIWRPTPGIIPSSSRREPIFLIFWSCS